MILAWSPRIATDDELADEVRYAKGYLEALDPARDPDLDTAPIREMRRKYTLKLEHLEIEQERRRLRAAIEQSLAASEDWEAMQILLPALDSEESGQ